MNKNILDTFYLFTVDGVEIPVKWLKYKGDLKKYVVFSDLGERPDLCVDDDCEYSIKQYDFDIYADGNYINILKAVKQKLKANGWSWVEDSPTMFEKETGLYHITTTWEIQIYNE
jgi:hypothetical protein